MKQTAVEYLVGELGRIGFSTNNIVEFENEIQIAKQIEKEQIKNAWLSAWKDSMLNPLEDKYYEPEAEQYYKENYGGNNEQQ